MHFLCFRRYMPRVRSQYIAEMRERFEVVDRVKASAEEKASLTKAIQEDEDMQPSSSSSAEVSPSKENTLRKDDMDSKNGVKLTFEDEKKTAKELSREENGNHLEDAIEHKLDQEESEEMEPGLKVPIVTNHLASGLPSLFFEFF